MFLRPARWLLVPLPLVCSALWGQCLDLTSTRLYRPHNRFEEHWDRPIWNAKPGEGNFHVENDGYGRALQFAIFTVKTVRKTPQGWVPYRASRVPEIRVDLTPERTGSLHYLPAYEAVPPTARLKSAYDGGDVETWSLSNSGVLQYTRRLRGHERLLGKRPPELASAIDFETPYGEEDNVATLDLNTGAYRYEQRVFCDGCYQRKFKDDNKLWRTITFTATARFRQMPCPASVERVSLRNRPLAEVPEVEMKERGVCAAKVTEHRGQGIGAEPVKWEFLQNPDNASRPDGCVMVFDSPSPDVPAVQVAAQKKTSQSEGSIK